MTDDLQARMALHTKGQITWPDLTQHRFCDACAHYDRAQARHPDKGRCHLVEAMHGFQGATYRGAGARACSKFKVQQ